MNIKITGKEVKATEAIREYLTKKLEKLKKYFDDEIDASLTIKVEGNEQIAEISVLAKGDMYRAVTKDKDLYASIDKDIDILEGQIRKRKTKKEKQNKDESLKQKAMQNLGNIPEIENEIIKTIYYDLKPMSPEDAKLKMRRKTNISIFSFCK